MTESTAATAAREARAARRDPVALARALHARFEILRPSDLEVDLMAWHYGASALWRDAGRADARVVRSGERAFLAVAKEARGTPRARFSIAHELGHHLMHADFDAIERIHGGARSARREFQVELEADRFASELLVPTSLARPRCEAVERPTLGDVAALARDYRVSLTVAAKRWPTMSRAACACFEAKKGAVRNVVHSESFRGDAIGGRALLEGMLALDMLREGGAIGGVRRRAHDVRWGSLWIGTPIVEECMLVAEGVVLGWLGHEAG